MFAVVRTGGKQYRVAAGDKIAVEKIPGEAGDSITLGDVLLSGEGGSLGAAGGTAVTAEIIAQAKGDKVIVFKKRRRHNYRRKQGHRQRYTILRITAVGDSRAEERPAHAAATSGTQVASANTDTPGSQVEQPVVQQATPPEDRLVAQEAPLKVEGTESELVDAPKKKSTRKPKAATGEADAASTESGTEA